jgi:hypothetical protein
MHIKMRHNINNAIINEFKEQLDNCDNPIAQQFYVIPSDNDFNNRSNSSSLNTNSSSLNTNSSSLNTNSSSNTNSPLKRKRNSKHYYEYDESDDSFDDDSDSDFEDSDRKKYNSEESDDEDLEDDDSEDEDSETESTEEDVESLCIEYPKTLSNQIKTCMQSLNLPIEMYSTSIIYLARFKIDNVSLLKIGKTDRLSSIDGNKGHLYNMLNELKSIYDANLLEIVVVIKCTNINEYQYLLKATKNYEYKLPKRFTDSYYMNFRRDTKNCTSLYLSALKDLNKI